MVPENTPPKTAVLRPLLSKPDDQSTKYLVAMWTMVLQIHPSTGWGLADRYLRSYRAWSSFSRPNLKMRISVPYCQTRHQTCEKKKGPVQNHNSNPSSTGRRSVGLCLLSNRASKLLLHSVGHHFHQKRPIFVQLRKCAIANYDWSRSAPGALCLAAIMKLYFGPWTWEIVFFL